MGQHDLSQNRKSPKNNVSDSSAGSGVSEWEDQKKQKKSAQRSRKLVAAVICIAAVLLAGVFAAYMIFSQLYSRMNHSTALDDISRDEAIAKALDGEIPGGETIAGVLETEEEAEEEKSIEDAKVITDDELDEIQQLIQSSLLESGDSIMSDKDVINILLIGSDARSRTETARSDAMILVSVNKNTRKIILTSFMRDIYTYIPDYGYNRLNASYAIAGADYLIETLEADFGVGIDNYAAVNFYDFADIIDALGGLDMELTTSEVDYINKRVNGDQSKLGVGTGAVSLAYSPDGCYHLNGTQVLAHCRNRFSSIGSDYDRTERQRNVITAVIEQVKNLSLLEQYNLAVIVMPMLTSDLTKSDCLSLLLSSKEFSDYEVETLRIPALAFDEVYINGMAVLQIDFTANAAIVQDTIYGD